jgi:hypothetical protein
MGIGKELTKRHRHAKQPPGDPRAAWSFDSRTGVAAATGEVGSLASSAQ